MVLAQIHNKYGELTEAERKVAAFVLTNPQQIISLSVQSLATQCNVAPSAVIRFCKSVNLNGFSDMKLQLAQEIGSFESDTQMPAFSGSDNTETVFRKVFRSGSQTLKDTIQLMNFEKAEKMTDVLASANRVFLFGIGTSSIIATDAQYRFSQMGIQATACTDILFMNVTAVNAQPGDAILCISHSGRTKAVVDALRHAKETGATTLSITSFSESPLYLESDISLSVYADEVNYPVEAVSARVAHLCIIDALMMSLATKKYDSFAQHIAARNKILREIRY